MRRISRAFFCVGLLFLTGCASLQAPQLDPSLPPQARVSDVPFFDQQDQQCGPASLASALAHSGKPVDPATLIAQLYLPARGGSLQLEMIAAARQHGRLAVVLAPSLQVLLQNIAAGQPVVVLQNLGLSFAPRWHYATVIGYDLSRQKILLHSGSKAAMALSLFTFENTWARSGRWALAITPPNRLPVGVSEASLAQAAVALERNDRTAAQLAHQAILTRWPNALLSTMALGNLAYQDGDLARAQQYFAAASQAHPSNADSWNNLANVLLARRQARAALTAAQRAVSLGGPRNDIYLATLAQIKARATP